MHLHAQHFDCRPFTLFKRPQRLRISPARSQEHLFIRPPLPRRAPPKCSGSGAWGRGPAWERVISSFPSGHLELELRPAVAQDAAVDCDVAASGLSKQNRRPRHAVSTMGHDDTPPHPAPPETRACAHETLAVRIRYSCGFPKSAFEDHCCGKRICIVVVDAGGCRRDRQLAVRGCAVSESTRFGPPSSVVVVAVEWCRPCS